MELLDIVDENDKVIGKASRKEIHNSQQWHRGVHVILLNSRDEILIQHRSMKKDKYPGKFDLSLSGHVNSGDGYLKTVKRELLEELGIKLEVKRLAKFRMVYERTDFMITVLFEARYDGEIKPEDSEVSEAKFHSRSDIERILKENPGKFPLYAREILKWYLKKPSKLIVLEERI
ncbi:MAG: NUDIX domain-containing protein [Candidatus Aenigmarchaeota archaeon]|nr:NUDIX domain-containing protein [Candidatus Aenigmarchaeota archaeon]